MQDLVAERDFYDKLFAEKPENEHIVAGYEELHDLAFAQKPKGPVLDLGCGGPDAGRREGCARAAPP